MNECYLMLVN